MSHDTWLNLYDSHWPVVTKTTSIGPCIRGSHVPCLIAHVAYSCHSVFGRLHSKFQKWSCRLVDFCVRDQYYNVCAEPFNGGGRFSMTLCVKWEVFALSY